MEIVSGKSRGLILKSPDGMAVRPTSVRSRAAFFNSLGDMDGRIFVDLCAGSGAMGLEAASRGAGKVYFFDNSRQSMKVVKHNASRVSVSCPDTEFEFIDASIVPFPRRCSALEKPDIIFADPPYADSVKLMTSLTADESFTAWASESILYWELPDGNTNLLPPSAPWRIVTIREFASTRFLCLKIAKT